MEDGRLHQEVERKCAKSRRWGLGHSWNSWGCVGWGDVRQGDNQGCGGGGWGSTSCAGVVQERSKNGEIKDGQRESYPACSVDAEGAR